MSFMTWPSRMILPLVGFSKPASIRSKVDLPQPEAPSRAKISPLRMRQADVVDRRRIRRTPCGRRRCAGSPRRLDVRSCWRCVPPKAGLGLFVCAIFIVRVGHTNNGAGRSPPRRALLAGLQLGPDPGVETIDFRRQHGEGEQLRLRLGRRIDARIFQDFLVHQRRRSLVGVGVGDVVADCRPSLRDA